MATLVVGNLSEISRTDAVGLVGMRDPMMVVRTVPGPIDADFVLEAGSVQGVELGSAIGGGVAANNGDGLGTGVGGWEGVCTGAVGFAYPVEARGTGIQAPGGFALLNSGGRAGLVGENGEAGGGVLAGGVGDEEIEERSCFPACRCLS